jgi:hypothetical protein
MPTGYTAKLCNEEVPFTEFVLTCARAFGALIDMKGDPLDKEIPEKFKPSSYHVEAIEEAKADLAKVRTMSAGEANAAAIDEYNKALAEHERSESKRKATKDRLVAMRSRVADWNPPTEDHQGLKDFMIQQLNDTIRWDGAVHAFETKKLSGSDWKANRIAELEHDIEYHTEEHQKEVRLVNERNAWVCELRKSLKR